MTHSTTVEYERMNWRSFFHSAIISANNTNILVVLPVNGVFVVWIENMMEKESETAQIRLAAPSRLLT